MDTNMRSESVEREFEKWSEMYIIPFDKEFQVKTMLELQEQYKRVPEDHIKTKREILYAIQSIQDTLKLQPKSQSKPKSEKEKILIVCNSANQVQEYAKLFERHFIQLDKALAKTTGRDTYMVESPDYVLDILPKSESLRGKRFHTYINLTGDKDLEDILRVQLLKNSDRGLTITGDGCSVRLTEGGLEIRQD